MKTVITITGPRPARPRSSLALWSAYVGALAASACVHLAIAHVVAGFLKAEEDTLVRWERIDVEMVEPPKPPPPPEPPGEPPVALVAKETPVRTPSPREASPRERNTPRPRTVVEPDGDDVPSTRPPDLEVIPGLPLAEGKGGWATPIGESSGLVLLPKGEGRATPQLPPPLPAPTTGEEATPPRKKPIRRPSAVPYVLLATRPRPPGDLKLHVKKHRHDRNRYGNAKFMLKIDGKGRLAILAEISSSDDELAVACRKGLREAGRWSAPIARDGRPVTTTLRFICEFVPPRTELEPPEPGDHSGGENELLPE